jgi:DNA primase
MVDTDVERLLNAKSIKYRIQGSDFVIKCLNPNHDDASPSFRVDKIKGIGHCFSCGFKVNIFTYFGVITNLSNIRVLELKEKIRNIMANQNGLEMLDGAVPMNAKFRGISLQTLNNFGAFYTDKVPEMSDRIIFPLKDLKGNTRVFVGRHMLSNANPRYMIYPKKVQMLLFPSKLEKPSRSMVLVEGIFDMLNLYDKGLHNVVATMGTNTLGDITKIKEKMLPFKAQGVTKVFICFDGDDAGKEAASKLKPQLELTGLEVEIIPLEQGTDPGELSLDDVVSIKDYISS